MKSVHIPLPLIHVLKYTHEPSTFIVSYNPTTLVPASQEISSFVSYSPHGYWTVDIPSGNNLNISLIDNLTFYFFISYQEATSENVVTPLFGNGMGWPAVVAPPSQYISGNCIDWVIVMIFMLIVVLFAFLPISILKKIMQ